jgi:hypothetical protein
MTLSEAISLFFDQELTAEGQEPDHHRDALSLLEVYFSRAGAVDLEKIACHDLRDFLSRWYVETVATDKLESHPPRLPCPQTMLDSLAKFLSWADLRAGTRLANECLPLIEELHDGLPRAIEISRTLRSALTDRGGAFIFSEFLTSFEEGGGSRYDIDSPGGEGSRESYFRVVKVEDHGVETEDLITEARVAPVIFPREVVGLIEPGYIINLEIVRVGPAWQIASCGFAYPPGTEF